MATDTTTRPVTGTEIFEKFYDLDCTERCEGDYEWDVNAWTCNTHRPDADEVLTLFHGSHPIRG